MTISVLMSVYHKEQAEYLHRALQSVWDDQTRKPDQIVLVEDGPLGEDLLSVIARWKQTLGDTLLVLRNETNLGLTKSLNKGIQRITTDLIARMDSDDISAPTRFEQQEKFLMAHSDIAVVGGSVQYFNDEKGLLSIKHFPTTKQEARKYIKKASPLPHPGVMMRTSVFRTIAYNEQYKTSQDIALWFDMLAEGYEVCSIEDIVLYFRYNEEVIARRGDRDKALNEFKIYVRGIRKLHGIFSLAYIYPFIRLCFRLLPKSIIKFAYDKGLQNLSR